MAKKPSLPSTVAPGLLSTRKDVREFDDYIDNLNVMMEQVLEGKVSVGQAKALEGLANLQYQALTAKHKTNNGSTDVTLIQQLLLQSTPDQQVLDVSVNDSKLTRSENRTTGLRYGSRSGKRKPKKV
jgi:hypothetical protein